MLTTSKYIKPFEIDKRLEKLKDEFNKNCIVNHYLGKIVYNGNIDIKGLYFIKKYYKDHLIIINGDVNLQNSNLIELPIRLHIVHGSFNIQDNYIKNFNNFPLYIGKNLRCNVKHFETIPTKEKLKDICLIKGRVIDKGEGISMDPPSGLLHYMDIFYDDDNSLPNK